MEEKDEIDRLSVESFVATCNDMLSGKFLDINKKLDQLLAVMAKSEDVLNLLADAIENYDEVEGFAKAFSLDSKTKSVKVTLPTDDMERLALTVTIFNDITSGKLHINQFLETYFKDTKMTNVQNFLEKIIRPFRDIICKKFEIDKNLTKKDVELHKEDEKARIIEEEKQLEEEQFPNLDQLLNDVIKICNQILALLKFEKKRTENLDDLDFILNSILKACEKRDLMVVNGLVIGLNYVSKKFKHVKYLVNDLNNLIYDYYEFLATRKVES